MASLPVERPLSARSGRVKTARRLARRSSRAEDRLFLAEGAKALSEALHLPGGVVEVFATEAASEQYAALRKAVDDMGISWFSVGDDAITALSGAVAPQGIVAVCRFLDVDLDVVLTRPVVEDRLPGEASAPRSRATVVICADVRDPGNAGTVIRTADATGADGVVLAGNSVDLYNDKTVRASVGSMWHLPIAVVDDPAVCVRRAQAAGFVVLAADGAGETDLFEAETSGLLDQPVAWLFGNEAWGLPDDLAALADHRVSIPIYGRAESLNLSTAAAVCLYAG
ncbi:MAG: methyltransferase, partial [Marmoricola sp.]|nr:methyltransferase [Marmoricola sp.]